MFEDKTLKCRDCGNDFVFTAGEQEFYSERGFQNNPSRCKSCRDTRRSSGGVARAANGDGDGLAGMGGSGAGGRRELFDAVCAECGKETKVPFRPRLEKPVYCSACFAQR